MPDVVKNLFSSRKDLMALLVLIASTAMVFTGKMPVDQWMTFVEYVGGTWLVVRGIEDTVTKREAIKAGASKGPPGGATADT